LEGRILLTFILKKWGGSMWPEFLMDSSDRLLWIWQYTIVFHRIQGISWVAERLLASQEGLCIMVTALWSSLAAEDILYCYAILDTTPQQLANYLLVQAETTIWKIHIVMNSTHRHMPDYQCIFRKRLQYRQNTKMHYSLWANSMDVLRRYWLHRNVLLKIRDGKIILSDQI
jgi:hypothetical protein